MFRARVITAHLKVPYIALWVCFSLAISVGAYYHGGVRAIGCGIAAAVTMIAINVIEGSSNKDARMRE